MSQKLHAEDKATQPSGERTKNEKLPLPAPRKSPTRNKKPFIDPFDAIDNTAAGECFRVGRREAPKARARGRESSRSRSFHHPSLGSSHVPSPKVTSEEAHSRRSQAPVGARNPTNRCDPHTDGSARGDRAAGAAEVRASGGRHPAGAARVARTVGGERASAHKVCEANGAKLGCPLLMKGRQHSKTPRFSLCLRFSRGPIYSDHVCSTFSLADSALNYVGKLPASARTPFACPTRNRARN